MRDELIFPSLEAAADALLACPSVPASADPDEPRDTCPICGLDPCGCGVEVLAIDGVIPIYDEPPPSAFAGPAPADRLQPWRHPAIAAAIDRGDALLARHAEKAVIHPSRPVGALARDLRERASAVEDRLARRTIGAEQAALALNTLATIGALYLALHARLAELLETQAGPPSGGEEGGPVAGAAGGDAAPDGITAEDSAGSGE